ncbi:uncharacterized protein LOC136037035 isoform X2 [Artemia franciscana]|uniref:uncharacterized protein LOC136037035 isoform X2 n=1 Tax=Artemia franciscana TaxID=6661 RepID=UPI0032DB7397
MNHSLLLKVIFTILSASSFLIIIFTAISSDFSSKELQILLSSNITCDGSRDSDNIISFSLFGDWKDSKWKSRFFRPMKKNILFSEKFYPGWILRIYHNLPSDLTRELDSTNVRFCTITSLNSDYITNNFNDINPRVWRYLALLDPVIEVVTFRDSDAIMLQREVDAVNEWLHSSPTYHVMRDNQYHGVKILAGMFGIKLGKRRAEVRKYTSEMIYRSIRNKNKDTDQNLLAKLFWDDVRNNCQLLLQLLLLLLLLLPLLLRL